MSKRTLFIILALVVALLIGATVFFFIFSKGERDESPLSNFFPFGDTNRDLPTSEDSSQEEQGFVSETGQQASVLQKISSAPVAGAVAFEKDEKIVARYIERETGHVYETELPHREASRITNTTIPRLYKAVWLPDGEEILLQYIEEESETTETFHTNTIDVEAGTLSGTFLPRNISELSLSPDGSSIFYIRGREDSRGRVSDPRGENTRTVLSPTISEWNSVWLSETVLALTTRPAFSSFGYLYFLNTQSGRLDKVLGRMAGLTTLVSPDRAHVIYAKRADTSFKTAAFNLSTKNTITLPLTTLPEKCVWSLEESTTLYCGVPEIVPPGEYPDIWYQGQRSFSDSLWEINTETGVINKLSSPTQVAGEEIDVISPTLSPNEEYLLFTNKKDSSLWSLRLKEKAFLNEESTE